MAGGIEDLFARLLGDFDWLEDLHCSPLEDRFRYVYNFFPCCYYNISHVAYAT